MRSKEKSTDIFFLRHGQTDFPIDRIYCDDKEDPSLNSNGIYQAKSAAILLKKEGLSAIYASPAKRTLMTSQEVSEVTGLAVEVLPEWVERKFGIWEGLYFNEIEEKYPEEYSNWKRNHVSFTPDSGETITDLRNRLSESLERLILRHRGEKIAIITHVGPIRVSLCEALKIPIENYRQIRVDYASISRVDYGVTKNNLIKINQLNYE